MTSRLATILSFVFATLIAAGAVELFYRSIEQAITHDDKIVATEKVTTKKPSSAIRPKTVSQSTRNVVATKKEDYTIITTRNLFGKVAAPEIKKETKVKPVLTTTSLDLTLLGTIGGAANDQRAIIRDKKKNTQDIYYKGDAISQALIKEISRGKIILSVNGRDEVLLMQESKSPPGGNQQSTMPEMYPTPDAPFNYDEPKFTEDEGSPGNFPPPAMPKRRMTSKSEKNNKQLQVTKP